MADVLTQSQIDALLSSMQGGGLQEAEKKTEKEEKKYRLYDFYSPKKFTKDRLRMIKGVYDNYCRIASSQVNSLFRTNSEMEVVTVEEQRYYEFSNSLNDNDILTMVDIKFPDNTGKLPPLLLHVSQPLMVGMIDRMLGGSSMDRNIDTSYMYTELEMPLYRRIMEYLIMGFKDAWSGYVRLSPTVSRIEENPGLFQDIGVDETIVIIVISMEMQGEKGLLSICIPEDLLVTAFTIIDNRKRKDDEYGNELPDVKQVIMDKMRDSILTVTAKLGRAEMSIGDVYGLRVGDVIDLNKPQDSEVCLYVEEQPWFAGQLGVSNKKVAVKINSRLDQETEEEAEVQEDFEESTVSINSNKE